MDTPTNFMEIRERRKISRKINFKNILCISSSSFAQFFGTTDPFASFFGGSGGFSDVFGDDGNNVFVQVGGQGFPGAFSSGFAGANRSHSFHNGASPHKERRMQDPPIEHDLFISLDEVFFGTVKKMKISRLVMQDDGSSKKEEKVLQIQIKPVRNKTVFLFSLIFNGFLFDF